MADGQPRRRSLAWRCRGGARRPYGNDGLILHQLYYANEVRAFGEIDTGAKLDFSEKELDLADKLIDQLTTEAFEPERYKDSFSDKVRAAVDQKVQSEEITVAPEAPKAQIIDLFEALKRSLETGPANSPDALLKPPQKTTPKAKSETKKKASKG
jgi:DNA end-binding protein Ku